MRVLVASALLAVPLSAVAPARAEGDRPTPHPTLTWGAAQIVPSPEWVAARGGSPLANPDLRVSRFGIRWQVTPVLYSFGIHRGLDPWRFFVVEPFVRQSGSTELFFSPEYFSSGDLAPRTGVRSYFPVLDRGEYLSVSIAASHVYVAGRSAAAFEAGIYAFFGTVGLQVTYSPSAASPPWIATLRLRYF